MSVEGCLACDAVAGRLGVPGGTIAETEHWHADHCIGPFGDGAVVVKTKAHIEDLWTLPDDAARELGPFLRLLSGAIVAALSAERVYLSMWVDKPPLHVHLVLYPRYAEDPDRALDLQVRRWSEGPPSPENAAAAAQRLRDHLAEA